MNRTDRNFLLGGVAAVAVLLGGCACGNRWQYSDGYRVGTVTKFSSRGAFVKSWEGEMVMGGVAHGDKGATVANLWQFTVTDPAIVAAVDIAQSRNDPVKLHYVETLCHNPITRSSDYTVTKVEPAE